MFVFLQLLVTSYDLCGFSMAIESDSNEIGQVFWHKIIGHKIIGHKIILNMELYKSQGV